MVTATRRTQGQSAEDLEKALGIRPLVEVIEPLNMFIYGDNGVGKTVLAASVNKVMSPVLFLNVEGGTRSIEDREGIEVLDMTTPRAARLVRQYLRDNYTKYRAVILDSLTEYRIMESRGVLAQSVLEDPTHDKESLNIKDWGKTHDRVREFVRFLRDLPIYVVVTALQESTKDELTGAIYLGPMLSDKLNSMIPGYFDLVGCLAVVEIDNKPVRRLYIQPTSRMKAKDRTQLTKKLGDHLDNPNMEVILKSAQTRGMFTPDVKPTAESTAEEINETAEEEEANAEDKT